MPLNKCRAILTGFVPYLWFITAAMLWVDDAAATKRMALVIGNSDYRYDTELKNPRNDATDIAAALKQLGFDVELGVDLTKSGMEGVVRNFSDKLDGSEVALVYYAGHGLQIDGKNYLVPVDANVETKSDIWLQTVDLDILFRVIEGPNRVNLIILDACRNNKFATALLGNIGAGRGSGSNGLAHVRTAIGSLVAFATEPGNVAQDGVGRNSPFTAALLRHIDTPGLEVRNMFSRVRQQVFEKTSGKQIPWDHSSLVGEFYFNPKQPEVASPVEPAKKPDRTNANNPDVEMLYWSSIKDSGDARDFEEYLVRWPEGSFARIAKRRLIKARGEVAEKTGAPKNTPVAMAPIAKAPITKAPIPEAPATPAVVPQTREQTPQPAPPRKKREETKTAMVRKPVSPAVAKAVSSLQVPDVGAAFTYACDNGTQTHRIVKKDSSRLEVIIDRDDSRIFVADTQLRYVFNRHFPYIGIPLEWHDISNGQNSDFSYPTPMHDALIRVSRKIGNYSGEFQMNSNAYPATIGVSLAVPSAGQGPENSLLDVKTVFTNSHNGKQRISTVSYDMATGWYRAYTYYSTTDNKVVGCKLIG